jgi:hypothetical protein
MGYYDLSKEERQQFGFENGRRINSNLEDGKGTKIPINLG